MGGEKVGKRDDKNVEPNPRFRNLKAAEANRSKNLPLALPWGPEQLQQVQERAQLPALVQKQAPPEPAAEEVRQVQRRP